MEYIRVRVGNGPIEIHPKQNGMDLKCTNNMQILGHSKDYAYGSTKAHLKFDRETANGACQPADLRMSEETDDGNDVAVCTTGKWNDIQIQYQSSEKNPVKEEEETKYDWSLTKSRDRHLPPFETFETERDVASGKKIEVQGYDSVTLQKGEKQTALKSWQHVITEGKKVDQEVIINLIKKSLGCDNVSVITKIKSTNSRVQDQHNTIIAWNESKVNHVDHSYTLLTNPMKALVDHSYILPSNHQKNDSEPQLQVKLKNSNKRKRTNHTNSGKVKEVKSKECKYCGQTFKCHYVMLDHVRKKHTFEKPFLCHQCGRGHFSKNALKVHEKRCKRLKKKDKAQRPFPCTECLMSFRSKVRLRLHYDSVHRPFKLKRQAVLENEVIENKDEMYADTDQHKGTDTSVVDIEYDNSNMTSPCITTDSTELDTLTDTPVPVGWESVESGSLDAVTSTDIVEKTSSETVDIEPTNSLTENEMKIYASYQKGNSKDENDIITCDICGKTIKGYKSYIGHIRHSHDSHCPKCKDVFLSYDTLREHLLSVHFNQQPEFCCEICGKGFYFKNKFTQHMNYYHATTDALCQLCGKEFKGEVRLRNHITKVHKKNTRKAAKKKIEPMKCEHCGWIFFDKRYLTHHLKKYHTGAMKEQCSLCEFKFNDFRVYPYHLYNMHNIGCDPLLKESTCNLCGKQYSDKRLYIDHLHKHYDLKPYKCETCNERFGSSSALYKHSRKHNPNKRTCPICKTHCSSLSGLKDHMNTHTGEKPHQCPFCPKAFSHKHALKLHEALHKNEKMFTCEICDAAYNTKPSLRAHLKSHGQQALDDYSLRHDGRVKGIKKYVVPENETQSFSELGVDSFEINMPLATSISDSGTLDLEGLDLPSILHSTSKIPTVENDA